MSIPAAGKRKLLSSLTELNKQGQPLLSMGRKVDLTFEPSLTSTFTICAGYELLNTQPSHGSQLLSHKVRYPSTTVEDMLEDNH